MIHLSCPITRIPSFYSIATEIPDGTISYSFLYERQQPDRGLRAVSE